MENKFKTDFKVTFFETDTKKRLAPGYLLALFQDTAVKHSEAVGFGVEKLLEQQKGWAILNWHICINRMPLLDEKIEFSTWCSKCGRLQAIRSFEAKDEKGEVVSYAITNWAFMDLEKRKPAKISPEMEEAYKSDLPNIIEKERYLIKRPTEEEFSFGKSFSVKRSDLDTNGHVNNTRYLVWAVDEVSDEIYENYVLKDIKVTYRKECKKDDELIAKKAVYEQNGEVLTVIYFVHKDEPETVYVQIGLTWSK